MPPPQPDPTRQASRDALWALLWLLCAPLLYWGSAWLLTLPRVHALLATAPGWSVPLAEYGPTAVCVVIAAWLGVRALTALGVSTAPPAIEEADWVRRLAWLQFEQLVEGHFTHRGYRVAELHAQPSLPARLAAMDGAGATLLVHYTDWKTTEVGFDIVKTFVDEIEARQARSGVLLTFGKLTRAAATMAASHGIEVIAGDRLTRVLRSSGWDSSRFRESGMGNSTGFGNSQSSETTSGR